MRLQKSNCEPQVHFFSILDFVSYTNFSEQHCYKCFCKMKKINCVDSVEENGLKSSSSTLLNPYRTWTLSGLGSCGNLRMLWNFSLSENTDRAYSSSTTRWRDFLKQKGAYLHSDKECQQIIKGKLEILPLP